MTLQWADIPGAPPPGTPLCLLADIPQSEALSVDLAGFPALVLRVNGGLRAYVNMCPHQFLPLDHRASDVRSTDGARLICSNHEAVFSAEDGTGLSGFALGCALSKIRIRDDGVQVFVA